MLTAVSVTAIATKLLYILTMSLEKEKLDEGIMSASYLKQLLIILLIPMSLKTPVMILRKHCPKQRKDE